MTDYLADLMGRVLVTDTCWFWLGSKNTKGYGHIHRGGQHWMVHRLSYTENVAPIPEGMVIDHTCHDPAVCVGGACIHRLCLNPAHLQATTNEANLRRQSPAAKTHCLRGHEYTDENTGRGATGNRYCKACRRSFLDRRNERLTAENGASRARAWAVENGHDVASQGRLPKRILAAYEAATQVAS